MYNRWADAAESSAIDAVFLDADIAFDEDDDEALSLALERSVSTTSVSAVIEPAEELRRINHSLEVALPITQLCTTSPSPPAPPPAVIVCSRCWFWALGVEIGEVLWCYL